MRAHAETSRGERRLLSAFQRQAAHEFDGAARGARGRDERFVMFFEEFYPMRDVSGVIFRRLIVEAKFGADEGAA